VSHSEHVDGIPELLQARARKLGLIIRKDEHFLFLLANGDLVVQAMRVDQLNQALNCYERGDPIHVDGNAVVGLRAPIDRIVGPGFFRDDERDDE
jgi:hypothetical protein